VQVDIGLVLIRQKKYGEASKVLREALASAEQFGDSARSSAAYRAIGALHAWQKQWPEAIAAYRNSISGIETTRGDLQDALLRAGYVNKNFSRYKDLVLCLLEQGGPTFAQDAFRVVEQAKARTLVDLLRDGKADI